METSFAFLHTAREMQDGRVFIADPLGRVLGLIDLQSGALEPVGAEGAGPNEWRQPDAVYPLPGDSTLLVDLGNARLTVINPHPDSVDVRRWERGAATTERVAGLRPPAMSRSSFGSGNQGQFMMRPIPLAPQDDWAVAPDGRVALVRAARVDDLGLYWLEVYELPR